MIWNPIILFCYGLVLGLLSPLDKLNDLTVDPYIADSILDFFKFVAYLVPLRRLLPIIAICFAILTVRITIMVVKTIWDLIPIL